MSEKITKEGRPNQFKIFFALTRRNLMVFLKNVPIVFFTLMVPLAVLAVYALFLRPMEISQIKQTLNTYLPSPIDVANEADALLLRKLYGITDCWMMSGILSVSCITVSLNTNYIMVKDKENDVAKDMISSPISSKTIMFSYFAFNIIITFVAIFIVYLLCLLWLFFYKAYMITAIDFFAILGVLLLSIISAALLNFFLASFIKSDSVLSTFVAIVSAAVGFLIGAYLPDSMLPSSIKTLTAFFPGTYSTTLLRNYFMKTPLELVTNDLIKRGISEKFISEFTQMFGFKINFFGISIEPHMMAIVIVIFISIFLVLNFVFTSKNVLKGFFLNSKNKEAKKKLLKKLNVDNSSKNNIEVKENEIK